jgi:hypothetical protein
MNTTMRRESIDLMAMTRPSLSLVLAALARMVRRGVRVMAAALLLLVIAATVSAQTVPADAGRWRIGASTGAYVPFSSLIMAADSNDTRFAAGPAFALEPQYLASSSVSIWASGIIAFGTIRLGSSIRPAVVGPSNQVMLAGGTAGVMLTAGNWLGEHMQPTLRLGGGFKWYSFDLSGADNQVRPTADIGLGFRGIGVGAIEVTAEVRYLPSSFDQGKLPTRGIAPQDQRQNDLFFSIGIGIRPGGGM